MLKVLLYIYSVHLSCSSIFHLGIFSNCISFLSWWRWQSSYAKRSVWKTNRCIWVTNWVHISSSNNIDIWAIFIMPSNIIITLSYFCSNCINVFSDNRYLLGICCLQEFCCQQHNHQNNHIHRLADTQWTYQSWSRSVCNSQRRGMRDLHIRILTSH